MELKLYRCAHCGNIAFKLVDKGVPLVCCGEPMQELKATSPTALWRNMFPRSPVTARM